MPIFTGNKGYFLLFVSLVICLTSRRQGIQGTWVMPQIQTRSGEGSL